MPPDELVVEVLVVPLVPVVPPVLVVPLVPVVEPALVEPPVELTLPVVTVPVVTLPVVEPLEALVDEVDPALVLVVVVPDFVLM